MQRKSTRAGIIAATGFFAQALVAGLRPTQQPRKCFLTVDDLTLTDHKALCSVCGRRLGLDDIGNGVPNCIGPVKENA